MNYLKISLVVLFMSLCSNVFSATDPTKAIIPVINLLLDDMDEPALPPCNQTIPSESPANGNYRFLRHLASSSGEYAVDIANRGWRAVIGGDDKKITLFSREQTTPMFTYQVSGNIRSISMNDNGTGFVVGDSTGKIYYFECDQSTPVWTYDANLDSDEFDHSSVKAVSISGDARYIAAISNTGIGGDGGGGGGGYVYLFRRDRNTPIMKYRPANTPYYGLGSLALSHDGKRITVGTFTGYTGGSYFHFLNHNGLIWSHYVAGNQCQDGQFNSPVAISADGKKMAGSGCDHRLYFWNTEVSTPSWSKVMPEPSWASVRSLALSQDGVKLVAIDSDGLGKLYFTDNTDSEPDWSSEGSWVWDGWLHNYSQPSVYDNHDILPGGDVFVGAGVSNLPNRLAMSADGNYFFVPNYNRYGFQFYKQFNQPIRGVNLTNEIDQPGPVAMSPDGSWIIMSGYSGEILRFEMAPVEKAWVNNPVAITDPVYDVDWNVKYVILKPGRAANLQQSWDIWSIIMGIPVPPSSNTLCSGTMSWQYNYDLPDGNRVISSSRNIDAPSCTGDLSGLELFYLISELTDRPSGKALSSDEAILSNVTINPGN